MMTEDEWNEFEEQLQRHHEESARKQDATLRKMGLAELDEDALEEAGMAAGREWAHNQTSDFAAIKRVAEAKNCLGDRPFWGLGEAIAGVDAEEVYDALDKGDYAIPIVQAVYRAQRSLIPAGEYCPNKGPGAVWVTGFADGVYEVWQETQDWLIENALARRR